MLWLAQQVEPGDLRVKAVLSASAFLPVLTDNSGVLVNFFFVTVTEYPTNPI